MRRESMKNTLNAVASAGLAALAITSTVQAGPIEQLATKKPGELICTTDKQLCAENLRDNGATAGDFKTAADHSFNRRVAILVHGGDKNTLNAAFRAAQSAAQGGVKTRFVILPDNDNNPDDAKIEVFSNGLPAWTSVIRNPTTEGQFNALTLETSLQAHDAYKRMEAEQKAKAEDEKKE